MTRKFRHIARALIVFLLFAHTALAQQGLLGVHVDLDELGAVKISPDGEYIAFTTGGNSGGSLRFVSVADLSVGASVDAPVGFVISDFLWSSNTRVIYTVARRSGASEGPIPDGDLYAVNRTGDEQVRIYTSRAKVQIATGTIMPRSTELSTASIVSLLDDDARNVLLSAFPLRLEHDSYVLDPSGRASLTLLDTFTGRGTRLDAAPLASAKLIADRADGPRFAIGVDGQKRLSAAWKATPNADWETFALPGFQTGTTRPQQFSQGYQKVLFTAVPEGEQHAALFELDLTQRSTQRLLDVPGADVYDVVNDPKTGELLGVATHSDTPVYQWLAPDNSFVQWQQALQRALPGRLRKLVSRSDGGLRAIVIVQEQSTDTLVLFNAQTGTTKVLAQRLLPLEHFTRPSDVGTMKLSPDGEYIALTAGDRGDEFLSFLKVGEQSAAASVRAPAGTIIHQFHWVSNTRVVFTVARRVVGDDEPRSTVEMFAVDRDGADLLQIAGVRSDRKSSFTSAELVSGLSGDDRHILVMEIPWHLKGSRLYYNLEARPQIARLDVYSGKSQRVDVAPFPQATIIVDRDDVPRFAIGVTESVHPSVSWKRSAESEWQTLELPGYRSGTVTPLRFTEDNSSVLFTGVAEGELHSALYQLNLADFAIKKVIGVQGADIEDLVEDFSSREAVGVTGYADKLLYRWILPNHPAARLQQALLREFEGNEVHFISRSADGRRAIVLVKSDVAPGEYLLLDTQMKRAEMLMAARKWIDIRRMRPKEAITLKARDGLTLHGYLTRPVGPPPYPLVVLPHGGPYGIRDVWGFDAEVQMFASRGYAVLQVNYRGSSGYGMDFEESGIREWGGKMQDDVTDATRWAIQQAITTPERICIYGSNYGGYAALMGVIREPKLYRCAIGLAGIYDLETFFNSARVRHSGGTSKIVDFIFGSDKSVLHDRSPVNLTAGVRAPVLLIHDDGDGRVNYEQAARMKSRLEQANAPVEWLSLKWQLGDAHDQRTRNRIYRTVLEFLDKHLMSASPSRSAGSTTN
jgi:dipeptidyl aminopeptidase/acylaminoacyl peptidase